MKILHERILRNKFLKTIVSLSVAQTLLLGSCQIAQAAPKLEWGNGILVSKNAGSPYGGGLEAIMDHKGNILFDWEKSDQMSLLGSVDDVLRTSYAQKFGPDGLKKWADPVLMKTLHGYDEDFKYTLTSDDALVMIWTETRGKQKPDVFAQKINADGTKPWGNDGITVYDGPGAQEIRTVKSDYNGGFIVVWFDDERAGLYMQRIDGTGSPVWQKDGISLNGLLGIKSSNVWPDEDVEVGDYIEVVLDGKDGYYLSWNDFSDDQTNVMPGETGKPKDGNIYIQHMDINGKKTWSSNSTIPLKNVYMSTNTSIELTVLEDSSVLAQWMLPVGNPEITKQIGENSFSSTENPNKDYYFARVSLSGELSWDYGKPLFKTRRSVDNVDFYSSANSIDSVPVKGGVVLVRQIFDYQYVTDKVKDSSGKEMEFKIGDVTGQTMQISKVDYSGKVLWEKELKGSSSRYELIDSYASFSGRKPGTDSFYVYAYDMRSKVSKTNNFRLIRFDSDTGAQEWCLDSRNIPNAKSIMWPSFYEDNNDGIFMIWREGLEPVTIMPSSDSSTPEYYIKEPLTEYKQSNIYIQHIVDDGSGWSDLQVSNWAYSHVQNLMKKNAISGYGSGEFKPGNPVTRAEFAKMVVLALDVKSIALDGIKASSNVDYSDTKGHWAEKYIKTAILSGTLKGYADGTIKPDAKITRAEAVAMVCRAKGIDAKASAQDFKDVAKDFWAFDDIEALSGLGTISGYGDGTFRPSSFMTRAESAKIVDLIANVMK
jgi:hypothetical protein